MRRPAGDWDAWVECMADRYLFLAQFPDLAGLADIEERELCEEAQRLLDDFANDEKRKGV